MFSHRTIYFKVSISYLQIGNMELAVRAEVVLLAGDLVHCLEGLLARLVARSGYQPVLGHDSGYAQSACTENIY